MKKIIKIKKIDRLRYIWIFYGGLAFIVAISLYFTWFRIGAAKTTKTITVKSYKVACVPNVQAEAFLAKATNSTTILYGKNIHNQLSPASLTKVMTAVLAAESGRLNDIVTITQEAKAVEPYKFGAIVGDKFLLKDLLIATMVSSSNDAAMAIGIHLGGSSDRFATMMNTKAKELGMKNTHFTNPCGLDIGENMSTAYDLMLLTEHAIKLPEINTIANYRKVLISNIYNTKQYKIKTHNKLLEYNPMAVGLKTGYTIKAGPCLIARAKNGKKDAILVILHSGRGARWGISKKYFDLILKQ